MESKNISRVALPDLVKVPADPVWVAKIEKMRADEAARWEALPPEEKEKELFDRIGGDREQERVKWRVKWRAKWQKEWDERQARLAAGDQDEVKVEAGDQTSGD